jgi:hypothetical protein
MDSRDGLPIACTLQSGSYQKRRAWIEALARDGLRGVSREDLRIELRYALDVATRVREMVAAEQECCGFLSFELTETEEDVRLTITAPDRARDVADVLFEQFVPAGVSAVSQRAARQHTQRQTR